MTSLFSFAAPLALLLPLLGQGAALVQSGDEDGPAPMSVAPDYDVDPDAPQSRAVSSDRTPLDAFYGDQNV